MNKILFDLLFMNIIIIYNVDILLTGFWYITYYILLLIKVLLNLLECILLMVKTFSLPQAKLMSPNKLPFQLACHKLQKKALPWYVLYLFRGILPQLQCYLSNKTKNTF